MGAEAKNQEKPEIKSEDIAEKTSNVNIAEESNTEKILKEVLFKIDKVVSENESLKLELQVAKRDFKQISEINLMTGIEPPLIDMLPEPKKYIASGSCGFFMGGSYYSNGQLVRHPFKKEIIEFKHTTTLEFMRDGFKKFVYICEYICTSKAESEWIEKSNNFINGKITLDIKKIEKDASVISIIQKVSKRLNSMDVKSLIDLAKEHNISYNGDPSEITEKLIEVESEKEIRKLKKIGTIGSKNLNEELQKSLNKAE